MKLKDAEDELALKQKLRDTTPGALPFLKRKKGSEYRGFLETQQAGN